MKKYIAEALGTGLLAFTVVSTAGDPFAVAAVLAIFIYAYAGVSGAHFNLAVTTAMWSRGEISCVEAVKYGVAQILGAVIAIAIAVALLGEPVFNFGAIVSPAPPSQMVNEFIAQQFLLYQLLTVPLSQMVSEFIASAVLLTAIFVCLRSNLHPAWGVALAHIVLVPMGLMINASVTLASFSNGLGLIAVIMIAIVQIAGGLFASKLDRTMSK